MYLFNSYTISNAIFCDVTTECSYPDPNSRILCTEIENLCGAVCSTLTNNNGLLLCNTSESWNCNLCSNDLPFWIPFEANDTIDFQFQQRDNTRNTDCANGWLPQDLVGISASSFATFEIRACCNDAALEIDSTIFANIVANSYVGSFNAFDYAGNSSAQALQQIRFNLDIIRQYMIAQDLDPCFYFVFNFDSAGECITNESSLISFYSEPFSNVDCKGSIKVESDYSGTDCFGYYYGVDFNAGAGGAFAYSNAVRLRGAFEPASFSVSKETINATLKTTASQLVETWRLRSRHLPFKFAKLLATIFAGRNVYVNGNEYQVQGEMVKNNDTGSQWYIEMNFEDIDCNKSLSCK